MTKLVSSLLALAKADDILSKNNFTRFDMSHCLDETILMQEIKGGKLKVYTDRIYQEFTKLVFSS